MRETRKPRVGVLYGGISAEREVSLRSGEAVANALASLGYPVERIDVLEAPISSLTQERMDVAFIALHGTFGEDGGIQSVLEVMGVPYTGSGVTASRLAMDKVATKNCFRRAGVPTAAFVELEAAWPQERKVAAIAPLGLPVVVKPAAQGSSVGVSIVEAEAQLPGAVARALEFDERAIAEEYIGGRELTVGVLGDRALPIIELLYRGRLFTWKIKYTKNAARHVVNPELPAGLAERVQDLALQAHRSLGCRGCSRVDFRLDADHNPFVLEVNTIPGMTETSLLPDAAAAVGIPFAELCRVIVEMALRAGRRGAARPRKRTAAPVPVRA
ncbi:MAG TPA: D-alanine--D-alanine ligase [Planctomycetota bacterium]|nr:D-alanine--D-alanine ligase [Planctomycetota bacterium]HRR81919.1 D-alanine--D-alanine ligase [Planctomycetota bacterium]HRT94318.1 D-alanine--D-alanine ligase [Planctomycetota bacterium]